VWCNLEIRNSAIQITAVVEYQVNASYACVVGCWHSTLGKSRAIVLLERTMNAEI